MLDPLSFDLCVRCKLGFLFDTSAFRETVFTRSFGERKLAVPGSDFSSFYKNYLVVDVWIYCCGF